MRPTPWMGAAVAALAVLCYVNSLGGGFVFDDHMLIVGNDIIKDPRRLPELFVTNLWALVDRGSNYYRPLPPLLFMLLHALFGMRPEPFHVVNVALHAGVSWLVFLLARTLLEGSGTGRERAARAAFAAAAIFAVHPIHTEAVAWISGVMDVGCTFFSLASIYFYVTRDRRDGWWREALSLVALALALLSKEPAVLVPVAFVAYDLLFRPVRFDGAAGALRRWGPPLAVVVVYLWARSVALGGLAPFRHPALDTLQLALTMPPLVALYLQKLVLPTSLNVAHHVRPVPALVSPELLASVLIIAAFAALGWHALRSGRTAAYGVVLFVLSLALPLYLPALNQDVSKAFAERYLYFPSAGAALVMAAGLVALDERSHREYVFVAGVTALVGVLFGGMTISRNTVWKDDLTLWTDTLAKSPDLSLAHESMGLALIGRGEVEEGVGQLRVAVQLAPQVPSVRYNLARGLDRAGRVDEAIRQYRAVLALKPDYADAHNNLGILLAQANRLDEAIVHFEAAVRAHPRDPEARLNLARAYEVTGRTREAAEQRALAVSPGMGKPR